MQRITSICLRCRFLASLSSPPIFGGRGYRVFLGQNGITQVFRSIIITTRARSLSRGITCRTATITSSAGSGSGLRNANITHTKGIALSNNWFEKNEIAASGDLRISKTGNWSHGNITCENAQTATTNTNINSTANAAIQKLLRTSSTSNPDEPSTNTDHETPSARTIQLGRTIRTLQTHLPTILQSPLPSNILSPQITLHLFPSTHPHLPVAKGKVAYKTALWTSPFVWGQIPGRTKLLILSERVIKPCEQGEQLIVRWRTDTSSSSTSNGNKDDNHSSGSSSSSSSSDLQDSKSQDTTQQLTEEGYTRIFKSSFNSSASSSSSSSSSSVKVNKEFSGLFIFSFDANGLLVKHTIENVDESFTSNYDGVGGKVIGVTEWLLKKARKAAEREKKEEGGTIGTPGLAWLRVACGRRWGRGVGDSYEKGRD